MKKVSAVKAAIIAGGVVLSLATGTAHADDTRLPKEYWGKWCATGSTTGGGSPRFMYYSRTDCSHPDDPRLKDQDMIIGPHNMDDCKAFQFFEWKEDGVPVYFVTYRCKDGHKFTAKLAIGEDGLTAQYHWIGK